MTQIKNQHIKKRFKLLNVALITELIGMKSRFPSGSCRFMLNCAVRFNAVLLWEKQDDPHGSHKG